MTVLPLARRGPSTDPVHVCLVDGGAAELRPLADGETAPLLEVFAGLSTESRASRYLVAMPKLPGPIMRTLASVDGDVRVAWLASVAGRPAGIARYIRLARDPSTAEIALEVVDEHQGRGLGTVLLDTISTVAAVNGVCRVSATMLAENRLARRLVSHFGMRLQLEAGVLDGTAPLRLLDPPRVDRSAVVELARHSSPAPGQLVWTAP